MTADAALFDLDGVLVDSRAAFTGAINAALAAHGLPERTGGELLPYLGPPLQATMRELAPGTDIEALVRSYRAHYRTEGFAASRLFDGIAAALDRIGAVMPLVVATSKAQVLAQPLLEQLGIAGRFRAIVGSDPAAP